MTFQIFTTRTDDKSLTMRYGQLAAKLTATKRAPAVREFRFFEAANFNRRTLSRLA